MTLSQEKFTQIQDWEVQILSLAKYKNQRGKIDLIQESANS